MTEESLSRRAFLTRSGGFVGGLWIASNWPLFASTAEAAVAARAAGAPFRNLTAAQAQDLEAIAAQIIPSGETPGAREAGVIYFMDGALGSFAARSKEPLVAGLADLDERVACRHGKGTRFSSLAGPQQIEMLRAIEAEPFFGLVQFLTVAGMFSLPEYGGNRDKLGWQLVGLEDRHGWQPPFGYYDAEQTKGNA